MTLAPAQLGELFFFLLFEVVMLYQNFLTPDLGIVRTGPEIKKALKTVPGVQKVSINSRKWMIEVEGEFAAGTVEAKLKEIGVYPSVISPVMELGAWRNK